jgi:hypothetical protein
MINMTGCPVSILLTFYITEEVRSNKADSNDSHRKRIVSQSFSFTSLQVGAETLTKTIMLNNL